MNTKRIVLIGILLVLIWAICLAWLHYSTGESEESNQSSTVIDSSRWQQMGFQLHSNQPYKEVVIPYTERGGQIYVQATMAGRSVECLVDTGDSYIEWTQQLNLPGKHMGSLFAYPGSSGIQVTAEWVQISDLRLGDYELTNIPTMKVNTGSSLPEAGDKPLPAVLGNTAFMHVVLTIDSRQHQLIVRQLDYDIAQQLHGSQVSLLTFKPVIPVIQGVPDYITVLGSIADRPVRFAIDTGQSWPGIFLASAVRSQLNGVRTGSQDLARITVGQTFFGRRATEVTEPIAWSLGTAKGRCPAFVIDMPNYAWQANIGHQLLKDYRVTIDYPHQKVLLEPFQANPNVVRTKP